MKIGLVLPGLPQYSETFFNHKIKGLKDSDFEIIVFSSKKEKENFFVKHRSAYRVYPKKNFRQIFLFVCVLVLTFLKNPSNAAKLFLIERKSGKSFSHALKIVYLNAHIISYKLDWLHFGFATMTQNRENVAKVIGAKMGVSFRGYDINIYPLKNPGCYKDLWGKVDKIHSISNYLHEKAKTLGLNNDKQFEIIAPAIDVSQFNFKKFPGVFNNNLKILTVGRLNWIKDYETAITAMKILKEKGINFIYNIIGIGKEFERLKFAAYQSGLDEEIFFLGQLQHKEITKYMNESDIYLQTSLQEGYCVSVLEAQATGMMCIVSDADGLRENIIDNVTGFIVERRKPEKFANKIIDVINTPEERRKEIALSARRRVEREFSIEEQKIKFKNFFTS